MNFQEASQKYKIPVKALQKLNTRGLIPQELNEEHKKMIEAISYVWGKEEFLRMQMSRINKKKRLKLVHSAELNKVEKYILSIFFNAMDEKRRVSKMQIATQVNTYLKVPLSTDLFGTIERMRKKAYHMIAQCKTDN